MNQAQVENLIATIFKVGGAALAAHGATTAQLSAWQLIVGIASAVAAWWFTHTSAADAPGSSQGKLGLIVPFCLVGTLLCSGCTSYVVAVGQNKVQTTITTHEFGLDIGVAPDNETPKIALGLITTTITYTPLSTNGPIFAPDQAVTYEDDSNGNPFSFSGTASYVSGNDASFKALTNGVMAQPLFRPASSTATPAPVAPVAK
jgi:hypothetical protein